MPRPTDKLTGRDRPAAANGASPAETLAETLRDYPPFSPPFPGGGPRFPLARARANLDHLLAERPRRLGIALPVLARAGPPADAALAGEDPRPFLAALRRWADDAWRVAPQPWREAPRGWRASRRDGPDILLSLLTDVGLGLGEVVRAHRPDYRWELDDDPDDREMDFWRQPGLILRAPRAGLVPAQLEVDLIGVVVHVAEGAGSPREDEMADAVADAVLGQAEEMWRAGNATLGPPPTWEEHLARR